MKNLKISENEIEKIHVIKVNINQESDFKESYLNPLSFAKKTLSTHWLSPLS